MAQRDVQIDALTQGLLTRRVVAWFVDAFILAAIGLGVWIALAAFTVLTLGFGAPLFALLAFLPAAYGWLCLISPLQSSVGQAVMGLAVARDADFGPPTGLQALVYIVAYCVTMALGVVWTAVAVVTTRHRTLHDIVSGLVVVRRSALRMTLTPEPMGWNMPGAAPHAASSGGGRPLA